MYIAQHAHERKTPGMDRQQPQRFAGLADGGAGVLEVVEDDMGGTYRAVYTVRFAEAVFVLHCFQ